MSLVEFSPIAVFAYRRTAHLVRVLDALEACPEFEKSRCFVFSDGPRTKEQETDVAAVRALLRARLRPNMTIVESPTNMGVDASIVAAVTRLCDEFGRLIVIEDDIVVAPCALEWFNTALNRYENEDRVWQISGHQFVVPEFAEHESGLFLPLTTSWGWATWKRAWDMYDPRMKGWERLKADRELRRRFDIDDSYPYADMLFRQKQNQSETWDIVWKWRVFTSDGLVLFPPRSLVTNIGFDETATHGRFGRLRSLLAALRPKYRDNAVAKKSPSLPSAICSSREDIQFVARALRRTHQRTIAMVRRMLGWR
jgi:hypothetical protein